MFAITVAFSVIRIKLTSNKSLKPFMVEGHAYKIHVFNFNIELSFNVQMNHANFQTIQVV